MGTFDKWSTPKQIKIERKGEPRPLRRGPLKKGERRKGQKARLDELLSSKKTLERYAEWITQRQRFGGKSGLFDNWPFRAFDDQRVKHVKLLAAALKDKIIEDAFDWWVWKP
jgi:hypothetical protein